MFFDHYPYTNFHNVNLDWVLQAVKAWGKTVEANNRAFIDLRAANESFKTYVTTYLQNLDVSDEINDKLDQLLADGILAPYMAPYIQTDVSAWLTQHITPTTPVVDNSLTISGAAADARATGERIQNEKNNFLKFLNPQIIKYVIGSLVWSTEHVITTEGLFAVAGTNRLASSSYVFITAGTTLKINLGYSVKYTSYSSVDFEGGVNSFTLDTNHVFAENEITFSSSTYVRFAIRKTDDSDITAAEGALAFEIADAAGLSVAGNYIDNMMSRIDITRGIALLRTGSVTINSKMYTTDFMPVTSGSLYYFAITPAVTDTYTTTYTRIICYDESKNFVSVLCRSAFATGESYMFNVSEIISVPATAKYIRISYPTSGVESITFGCYGAFDQIGRNETYKHEKKITTLNNEKFAVKKNNPDMVHQIISIAESYRDQRRGSSYIMHYGTNTPLSTTYQGDKSIDCSTFIGFVLRGIPFLESPYMIDYSPEDLDPFDTTQFVANSAYLWSINPAKYEYDLYQDVDYPQYAEARRASQIAQMFAEQGRELPLDKYMANIEAGDLLFFSLKNADESWRQPDRYRQITHIALVIDVAPAPADATWDTSTYPYAHTYIDVSGGSGTDPVRVKVLEGETISGSVYGLGSLSCVMRPDLGAITASVFDGKKLVFHDDGTVTWTTVD